MPASTAVTDALKVLLASSYTLYVKTHKYHWNVVGPMFTSLHTMFETQYTEYAMAVDEIAERIRALGELAPGSFTEFAAISAVSEDTGFPAAKDMIAALVADQRTIAECAATVIAAAEAAGDTVSGDLAVRRREIHEKNAWMLQSHLEG